MKLKKVCSRCRKLKPLEDFHRSTQKHDGRQTICKECGKEVLREDYTKHREKRKATANAYYWANREACLTKAKKAHKRRHLLRVYGLTLEEYKAMLEAQDGKCAICKEKVRRPVVDHDHATGAVRGLLCGPCNTALGIFKDDVAVLQAAIDYLTNPSHF